MPRIIFPNISFGLTGDSGWFSDAVVGFLLQLKKISTNVRILPMVINFISSGSEISFEIRKGILTDGILKYNTICAG